MRTNGSRRMKAGAGMALLMAAGFAWFHFQDAHNHGHSGHSSTAALTLDQGKRWSTDEPLRKGMAEIRRLVTALPSSPEPAQLAAVGEGVRQQVAYVISNCKLDPKADAVLHTLIAQMVTGAEALGRSGEAAGGMAAIHGALERYPEFFDHPGWQTGAAVSPGR